ncbi:MULTISPECIES: Eco29kI family restriction endonuclease [Streptomyces]|uniref:Eco29kI family restriction endonuclease n=1 Tax=Streptomyces TaxID=1883 RepID=UPI00163C1E0C|nr:MULTISPECIES: Eco29kI family restriction endonuclease [Streptomyces]MBC2877951.1 Eco29kI family restriction endonuclease [Streptomyces sp. TYQ1024]UBI38076.1 Eco29kI family restriction endonuclease [Streptomyces mobaraensis]UKW30663.1 Eco29kI family restriction endonuclease [Streptomyces sp. TYQ1024]
MSLENHAEFKLSITKALGDQLADALKELTPAPLTVEKIRSLRPLPGVYQLYKDDDLVYVGKADRSLPQRIEKHYRKISGRTNISLDQMAFTCLYVDEDFGAVAPERLLINRHRGQGEVPWNYNGFGNNDPGKRRDTTEVEEGHFDHEHPINLEYQLTGLLAERTMTEETVPLSTLLQEAKAQLPYVFRYQASKEFDDIDVELPNTYATADETLKAIAARLPDKWQITALPGYLIMYPKAEDYPSARRYYRNTGVVDVWQQ